MDKLDQILRAEEAARHTVAEARERATAAVSDAEAQSRVAAEQLRATARAQAERIRRETLDTARHEADSLASASLSDLESSMHAARSGLADVVESIVRELVS